MFVTIILAMIVIAPLLNTYVAVEAQGGDYIWGYPGTARGNLNPFTAIGVDSVVSGILFSTGLIYISPNGSFVPWAASSWEFRRSGNLTEVYFYIRDNVYWSDGKPLTADDYIFTWKYIYLPFNKTLDPQGILKYVVNVDKTGEKILRFTVSRNTTLVFVSVASRIAVPQHVWRNIVSNISEADFSRLVIKPGDPGLSVTLGPFTLEYYDPQSEIVMKASKGFFMGSPHVERFRIKLYQSTQSLIPAILRGEIDSCYFSPTDVPTVLGSPGISVEPMPWSNNIFYLWTNNQVYPTNITDFRIALSLAINRKILAERAGAGYGIPRYNFIPPVAEDQWLNREVNGTNMAYDPDRASQILDRLGFKKGADGVRISPDGKRLSFELDVPSISDWLTAAQLIASDLQKVGIEVNIRLVALPTYVDIRNRGAFTIFFGSRIYSLLMLYDPAAYLFQPVFHSNATAEIGQNTPGTNWARVRIPELDSAIDSALSTDNPTAYRDQIMKIQEILHRYMPIIPLYSIYDIKVYRSDRVEGIQTGLQTLDTLLSIKKRQAAATQSIQQLTQILTSVITVTPSPTMARTTPVETQTTGVSPQTQGVQRGSLDWLVVPLALALIIAILGGVLIYRRRIGR